MQEAGLEDFEEHVLKRNNICVQYIKTQLIIDLCEEMGQRTGTWVSKRWWKQWGGELAGEWSSKAVAL